jgi:uncharacterized coiled-coil protein SlyX
MSEATNGGGASASTRIEQRIEELRAELAAGERRLAELDAERAHVRDTMLRIEGALMALTELGGPEAPSAGDAAP